MFVLSAPGRRLCVLVTLLLAAHSNAAPALPNIPTNIFDITNYGAVSGSILTNTAAIQATINAAATSAAHGGIVEIPAGTYLSGPLNLSNSINLQIDNGATLQMLPYGKYPAGDTQYFVSGSKLHDLEFSGKGAIDGQGLAWWTFYSTNKSLLRSTMVFLSDCDRVLFQNITLQNPPMQHIAIKGSSGNVTVQGIIINTPLSPNTDGIDLAGTNCLVQNSSISDGDDNIAIGSSGGVSAGILVTNCAFGLGHGVSVGSDTESGVSNLTVINCTFNSTTNGIRLKSDNDRGGLAQNLAYLNLGMTNVDIPITIYSYYNEIGTPDDVTPQEAATEAVAAVTNTTPIWRNILISNLTATTASGEIAGIIWGRTELPVTNVTLANVNITASRSFDIYNAQGIQFVDSQITLPAGNETFTLYNAGVLISNSLPMLDPVTFAGLASSNSVALYNAEASMTDSNALDSSPLALSASTLTVSNNLVLSNGTALNFFLGSNSSQVVVSGNLMLDATLNITNGGGFGAGTFALFDYGGSLGGTPVLGATPLGYTCSLDTNSPGQVRLLVQSPIPPRPAFTAVQAGNGSLVMCGSGGPLNTAYDVLTTTNLLLPLAQWLPIATNQFDSSGNFGFTNSMPSPHVFYLLRW